MVRVVRLLLHEIESKLWFPFTTAEKQLPEI
jgi:hypothetical protein